MQHILFPFSFLFFLHTARRVAAASAHEQRIFVLVMPVMTTTTTLAATTTQAATTITAPAKQNMLPARLELGQLPQLSHESQPGASVSKFYLAADCDCGGDVNVVVVAAARLFFKVLLYISNSFVALYVMKSGLKNAR